MDFHTKAQVGDMLLREPVPPEREGRRQLLSKMDAWLGVPLDPDPPNAILNGYGRFRKNYMDRALKDVETRVREKRQRVVELLAGEEESV